MLRIAVPNKGALSESAAAMLSKAGYRQRSDTKDLVLVDDINSRKQAGHGIRHQIPLVTDHDHRTLRRQCRCGAQHVADQRKPTDLMKDLRRGGLHPRPLACRQNDDGDGGWVLSHAPPPGLEPRLTEPESAGLPITPYPKRCEPYVGEVYPTL